MNKAEISKRIIEIGIVPVVRASSPAQAVAAAEAVCAGGISVVEVTMTVPGAVEVIAQLVKKMGSAVIVGAGTVLNAESARRCLDAGAQFLVSPGFDLGTVKFACSQGVLMMAGALPVVVKTTLEPFGSAFKLVMTKFVSGKICPLVALMMQLLETAALVAA